MASDDDDTAPRHVRMVSSPLAKQAGAKKLLRRMLAHCAQSTGEDRVVGVFALTITKAKGVGLAYALTVEELPTLAQAVPEALPKILDAVRVASLARGKKLTS